ncbi:ankyrin repeat domain-containing protein [Psychrobacillus sp. NPDC096389]|uniref:ankyrin repeat domain-containing protein n=1 Tax=Psychrobacillus sp. NPDC096389 TaxID=3364490 RepID=UPI003813918D
MKLKGISMSFLVVMLTACSTTPDSEEGSTVKLEKKGGTIVEQQLVSAATEGDIETVLELLEGGANINATNNQGVTAVMAATQKNNVDTVKILIEQGADIDIRNNNMDNVLLYAGAEGLLEILKLAIQAGADTTITNRFGGTALIPASDRGHVDIVEELLTNSDTDVNHLNNLHWTALLEAVILGDGKENYQEIVQLLVEHGADVNISDRDGVTPLEHAERRGFKEIERILKEAGA